MRAAKTYWAASTCAAGTQTCAGDMAWPGEAHCPAGAFSPATLKTHALICRLVSVIRTQSSGGSEDSQCQGEMFREVRSEEAGAGLGEARGPQDNG